MLVLFLFALALLGAWVLAVVAFQATAAAVHLLLVLAVALFAVGFMRRRFPRTPRRTV